MIGQVSLVGAGPGDADLLTRRAVRRLRDADLVLYDALVAPPVLELASQAQRFSVGKRAGRRSVRQETIHRLMVRAARRGKRVVRLKAGDPFVLGRGGEEAVALRVAGIPFEVVPGVTSAVAAAGLAGIPVTHRGLASGFLVVSGHAEVSYRPILEAVPPGSVTLVVLMGLERRAAIARVLRSGGWSSATPVAILLAASTPAARTWIGTLGDLVSAPVDVPPERAGTIVIGDVVKLRALIGHEAEPDDASNHARTPGGVSVATGC